MSPASVSGSFFPRLLRHWIALGMPLVRSELAPAMSVQQVIYGGQGHATAKRGLQFGLDLRHHQDAAITSAFKKRRQDFRLALDAKVLPPSPTRALTLSIADGLASQKSITQLAGPTHRLPDDTRRLLQTQAVGQRQHHRLRLPQLVNRLRTQNHLLRHLQYLRSSRQSGHRTPHRVVDRPLL